MTGGDHMAERSECGCDAAAYVLGALDAAEAAGFRRHLTGCTVCRDEVSALQAVVDALPMAAPQLAAPASLRRRLMTEVRADAKRRGAVPGRRLPLPRLTWPTLGRPAVAVGALVAAIAVTLGIYELSSGGSTAPRVVQASVAHGSGSAVLRLSGGHAELTVQHMPAPPPGRIYEVWLQRDGRPPSPTNSLFGVTSSGAGAVDVPGNLHGVRAVLVTPEPLGGSAVPTHAPVIVAQLSRG